MAISLYCSYYICIIPPLGEYSMALQHNLKWFSAAQRYIDFAGSGEKSANPFWFLMNLECMQPWTDKSHTDTVVSRICMGGNAAKSCQTLWGRERREGRRGHFFRIYAVTVFVKAPRDWLQWINAGVFWHLTRKTHRSPSVPKCAVSGTAAGKHQKSEYHSDFHEYKKSNTEDDFLSECVFNRSGLLNQKSTE